MNHQNYFSYFQQECQKNYLLGFPLIKAEVEELCLLMQEKIASINSDNFFEKHAEILGIDARLQIIFSLLPKEENGILSYLSEEEILELSRKDYPYYMRELCGVRSIESPPHSLHFYCQ
ncbi:hypothetical protein P7H50_05955 [Enterococcus durans]|uniref:DUF7006 family protein n=1 Tax=Enterococcus durans TaxID=53345 RepID=UPI00288D53C4|nr:hypothetical protein [Enterococcus durans]MDT2836432.1 hypothetical protein [Enterococcus durans]